MNNKRILSIGGAVLDKYQLENYLKKIASDHVLKNKSDKNTYPIPRVKENYEYIYMVFKILNEHLKIDIPIHPAGEWILDNFYIIEKTVKTIIKELTLKKYTNFIGIENGQNSGFARIYVLAQEIVSYTDSKLDDEILKDLLKAYQTKKTLNMDEIWNIGVFLQIALIENIRKVCEKIYSAQIQKYKVENIIERLIENKDEDNLKFKNISSYKTRNLGYGEMKYPFIEHMSYRLRSYGKSANSYINILENEIEMMGTSVSDVIKKEHFDIALKKVSVGNSIVSINKLSRINFLQIFEEINGVEEILKNDPANVYDKMDYKTKINYRNKIKEISKKTKISEIYIAKKCIEIALENSKNSKINKKSHIGYYLIGVGKKQLLEKLTNKKSKTINKETKIKLYIGLIWSITLIICAVFSNLLFFKTKNIVFTVLTFIFLLIPIQTIIMQTVQFIASKIVKPKMIPKLDFTSKIPEEYSCMVIIPTIIKSKEKVEELLKKMEVYFLANKSDNIYFTLLGDCSAGAKEIEEFDDEISKFGKFIYRKRMWNNKEECFLGYERKRGYINQFNEYMLKNTKFDCFLNTIEDYEEETKKSKPKIKYIITLDADTDLVLGSAFELVGAMAHILNRPVLNESKDLVVDGYGIIAPRVGVGLSQSNKNLFTKIFVGLRSEQILIQM